MHDPKNACSLPYHPMPAAYPKFVPKDRVGDCLEEAVTRPLHGRYMAVARPLHDRWATASRKPLHDRYTAVTRPLHGRYITGGRLPRGPRGRVTAVYPPCNRQVGDYLEDYAARLSLRVRVGTEVIPGRATAV